MSRTSDIVRNIFAGFGLIVFLLIAVFAVATMRKAPIHQFNLWTLGKNFKVVGAYHPKDSKYMLRVRDFGNLFRGASNGCDYLVGEVRVGKGSHEDIMRRYDGVMVKSFDDAEPVPAEVRFFDTENWMDPYRWSDWKERAQAHIDAVHSEDTPYLVFARQSDYPPDGDIRCH